MNLTISSIDLTVLSFGSLYPSRWHLCAKAMGLVDLEYSLTSSPRWLAFPDSQSFSLVHISFLSYFGSTFSAFLSLLSLRRPSARAASAPLPLLSASIEVPAGLSTSQVSYPSPVLTELQQKSQPLALSPPQALSYVFPCIPVSSFH